MLLYYSLLSIFTAAASAGSLTDIKHVVLFMQENRAFDHYFGTMPGKSSLLKAIQNGGTETYQVFADSRIQMCKSIQMANRPSNKW